jgi:formylglycine-generating enzyme required for sulfatase activity
MSERPRLTPASRGTVEESRLLPLSVAGLVCFALATLLGYGLWYLFGTHERAASDAPAGPVRQTSTPTPAPAPPPVRLAPGGELPVPGGEVSLGGEDSGLPLRREFVEAFSVGETEVTNEQYREFVRATGHRSPEGWEEGDFPPGAAPEPVTGVSRDDAVEYCKWLSKELGAEVRLPTEAEWELAARGRDGRKYPWGEEWNARAADVSEKRDGVWVKRGRVRAVRSFPAGKSAYGAYDMAGNVWEWVSDEARDEEGRPKKSEDGFAQGVIKGGSVQEEREFLTATARFDDLAPTFRSPYIGFRYVVVRKASNQQEGSAGR